MYYLHLSEYKEFYLNKENVENEINKCLKVKECR